MKIKKLVLENFRRFSRLKIDFNPQLTVIVGVNGAGKTSILDGIAILFGRLLSHLPNVEGLSISTDDLRMVDTDLLAPRVRCYLQATVDAEHQRLLVPKQAKHILEWSTSKSRDKSKKTIKDALQSMLEETNVGTKDLINFADLLIEADNAGESYLMPVIAYYGTDRATFSTPLRRRNFATVFARFDSLSGALNPSANFKRVFEWMHAKENEEARERVKRKSFEYQEQELAVVRRAIELFFPRFFKPRTELNPLKFVVDADMGDGLKTYDLNQLSDGYRTTLALVADLACRMAEANPSSSSSLSDALNSEAIVLIDEIELHLHPGWQQTIIPGLRKVFPNTQFIVTTHSPQILTTVPSESIRIVQWGANGVEISVPDFSLGAESQYLLETILGVSPRPPNEPISLALERYLTFVNRDQWDCDEALGLRKTLDAWGGGIEPALINADMDIRVRAWKRQQT